MSYRISNSRTLAAVLVSMGLALPAVAQPAGNATTGTSVAATQSRAAGGSVASADRSFMEKAAQGGLAEVELGQLAKQKASSNDVKQFAQRMIDDHSKANDRLKQVASSKGVTLPTDLAGKDQREKDRLSKLSGTQFDKAYMDHMVSDHKQDVSEFKSQSTKAKDPDVKNFVDSTLPTLEEHLRLAESTDRSLK